MVVWSRAAEIKTANLPNLTPSQIFRPYGMLGVLIHSQSSTCTCIYARCTIMYLQHPLEAAVVSLVHALQIIQGDGQTEELLVEGKSETAVDVEAVKDSHTQHTTDKVEVG